jgi:hypothetical protein
MNKLDSALKQFQEAQRLAAIDLDGYPRQVRPGLESQKRQAADSLEVLKTQYAAALREAAWGVAVSGPGSSSFATHSQEEVSALVVQADCLYRRLADRISGTMGSRGEFGVTQYGTLMQELRLIADELGLSSMPAPKWTEPVNVNGYEGLLLHVRNMVHSAVGSQLEALFISLEMTRQGLAAQVDRSVVPVILTGIPEGEEVALLNAIFVGGRSTVVKTTTEVTAEYVTEVFTNVKKSLKAQKQSKQQQKEKTQNE